MSALRGVRDGLRLVGRDVDRDACQDCQHEAQVCLVPHAQTGSSQQGRAVLLPPTELGEQGQDTKARVPSLRGDPSPEMEAKRQGLASTSLTARVELDGCGEVEYNTVMRNCFPRHVTELENEAPPTAQQKRLIGSPTASSDQEPVSAYGGRSSAWWPWGGLAITWGLSGRCRCFP